MKLEKILFFPILLGVSLMQPACDAIDEADRLIEVEQVPAAKCVLIEDFTGQNCVNCPNAALEAIALQNQYGTDKVIVVSIHAGAFALAPERGGLKTELGEKYMNYWKVESFPTGIIDRKSGLSEYSFWGNWVRQFIGTTAPADLSVQYEYDEKSRTLHLTTEVRGVETCSGKLQLWLVESNIVARQKMPDGSTNKTYLHQHVFRDAVNGDWGENLSVLKGEIKELTHQYTLPETWLPENISVIGFLYNDSEVLQSTQTHLHPNKE